MSLQYIIDGYNITKHRLFARLRKNPRDPSIVLPEVIRSKKLCGSEKNKITIVFDGWAPKSGAAASGQSGMDIIYSCDASADFKIKSMVEKAPNVKTVMVVSDDREIAFFVKAAGATCLSIKEFLGSPESNKNMEEASKPELTYMEMREINRELAKRWLK